MRLLVLGGAWFLGRSVAEDALARGWSVTTFGPSRPGTHLLGADLVTGSRSDHADLELLDAYRSWDVVVDVSARTSSDVVASTRALAGKTEHYVLLSSVSAYKAWPNEPLDDESELRDDSPEAGCECALAAAVPEEQRLVVRAGASYGPFDYVGLLPWLLARMERGGRVLAAGDPRRPIQPLDVRDLAAFTLDLVERGEHGTLNAVAPLRHSTYGRLFEACRAVTDTRASLTWVDREWLVSKGVPLSPEAPEVHADRAWRSGLRCRSLTQTVADTWEWMQSELPVVGYDGGLEPAREQSLLQAWDSQDQR